MKKLIVIVLAVLLSLCAFAYAEESKTEETVWNDPSIAQELKDEGVDIDHQHKYNEYEAPVGVGVDLILWKFGQDAKLLKDIKTEVKYDFNNEATSAFVVVTMDLPSLFNK